jgi:hypothetical protein
LTGAILPIAGKAIKMRGLPKFLLPAGPDYLTCIERHVEELLKYWQTIWIPIRPEHVALLESLEITTDMVVVLPMTTHTMTETVLRITGISEAERFVMVMPDTYPKSSKGHFQGVLK